MVDKSKLTKSEIIEKYRWTKRLVDKYLLNPELKHNYRAKSKPIKLYAVEEVKRIMETADFKKDFAKVERRRKLRTERT